MLKPFINAVKNAPNKVIATKVHKATEITFIESDISKQNSLYSS